jgi:diadenosine tetraphosphate (Ap4A) HIT family hydrolase
MNNIYETKNFIVHAPEKPLISRLDGGHIRIKVKDESISDRTKLSPAQAIELMRLTIIAGEAMEKILTQRGIPIIKINYQEMGNWAYKRGELPYCHVQIFGRAKNATKQPFPESVYLPDRSTGFYDDFIPLNEDDVAAIHQEMTDLFKLSKFSDEIWGLDKQN